MGCCLWFWPVIWASRSTIIMDAATAPIAMTTPSPTLTPVLVPGTAALCPLWILGPWAGPTTCEVKWSWVCDLYHILLLPINESLLDIIPWPVIIYYYCFCYALLHYSLLRIITILLLHCYYIIITYYYILHCYLLLHFLLLHCYYIIITYYYIIIITYYYQIIITCYYIIITSLLRHYYVIITSLLRHYYFIIPNCKNR